MTQTSQKTYSMDNIYTNVHTHTHTHARARTKKNTFDTHA